MNINFANIPFELKMRPQWVNWRFEGDGESKRSKVPLDPKTGRNASVINPGTWVDFNTAVAASSPNVGIGFVLTADDPFALIDLDDSKGDQEVLNTQKEVYRRIGSYTEISPSNNGVHIIVKGSLPQGRKRNHIELYSEGRFMTMTGNFYNGSNPVIEHRHDYLNDLFVWLGGRVNGSDNTISNSEEKSDDKVMTTAWTAKNGNGERFQTLWRGDWDGYFTEKYGTPNHHKSQSEGDFALIDMLAFHTQNRAQVRRLFDCSALGQRKKARRDDYIEPMITDAIEYRLRKLSQYKEIPRLWAEYARNLKKSGG